MVIYSGIRCSLLKVLIVVCELQLCILIANAQAPEPLYHYCPNTTTYNQNSTYQTNLNRFLSNVSSTNNLYLNATEGNNAPNVVYGMGLCRGDITSDACRECLGIATTEIIQRCPKEKESIIWYEQCMLRYNNISFFGNMATVPGLFMWNMNNVSDPALFDEVLGEVMDRLIDNASGTGNVRSLRGFATEEANYTSVIKLFNLVQCTPDLSSLHCSQCLREALANRPAGKQGGRVLYVSCTLRYEIYPFYNIAAPPPSPPPSPSVSPVLPPPPNSTAQVPDIGSGGNGGLSTAVIVAIVLSITISIVLFTLAFCLIRRKAKKQQNVRIDATGGVDGNNISAAESLQYDLTNIKTATNNFSPDNKIGEGGFGEVFKGTLNGQQIAVKRLSKTSGQGEQEFKNEVLVVAKLQHRNLVRLLGYCLDEGEKILIYEFVPNKSLDFILFGLCYYIQSTEVLLGLLQALI
ncbi:transmembrane signal receptor [Lithospermum erythrorhizon]|uniref:Transmembrane signal receptor n=1 Tax=Lithospermum erythrorhizon TaxID=34254 RepID=A0AAV3RLE4_LITER